MVFIYHFDIHKELEQWCCFYDDRTLGYDLFIVIAACCVQDC